MSQASMNVRESEPKSSRRSYGVQLIGVIFMLAVLGILGWGVLKVVQWMEDPERLPLSRLVVSGDRQYTTNDDLRQAIMSLGEPGTFMTQDVNVIQQQIERLTWIKRVSVRKQWPDQLKLHVVEYRPVARWNDTQMVDSTGTIFSLPIERSQKLTLPLLYGPEGTGKEVLDGFLSMQKMLTANRFTVKSVAMTARRSWQITLDNDVRLELGRQDRNERLLRFTQLYPLLVQQGEQTHQKLNYIDLRYDTGVAVGWIPLPNLPPISGAQGENRESVIH